MNLQPCNEVALVKLTNTGHHFILKLA